MKSASVRLAYVRWAPLRWVAQSWALSKEIDHDTYQQAFSRLLRDLKPEAAPIGEGQA